MSKESDERYTPLNVLTCASAFDGTGIGLDPCDPVLDLWTVRAELPDGSYRTAYIPASVFRRMQECL